MSKCNTISSRETVEDKINFWLDEEGVFISNPGERSLSPIKNDKLKLSLFGSGLYSRRKINMVASCGEIVKMREEISEQV